MIQTAILIGLILVAWVINQLIDPKSKSTKQRVAILSREERKRTI